MKSILTSFYSNLFKKEEIDLQNQEELFITKTLNSQSSAVCNGHLTLEELTNSGQLGPGSKISKDPQQRFMLIYSVLCF
mgnify:CR=1 FL=1